MHQRSKTILFVLFIIILWLPLIQQQTKWFGEIELRGAFIPPAKPVWAIDSLPELKFQKQFEDFQNWNFGFRGFMVKTRNSFNHLLFGELSIKDNVTGKDGFIFQTESTEQTLGISYAPKADYKEVLDKTKFLKEGIEKHGGKFVAVIAPSKEKIYPDYLPRPYLGKNYEPNAYTVLINDYKKAGIPVIDLSAYFLQLVDTCKFPLFNKTSYHWSLYGAAFAQDSILTYLEQTIGKAIPHYKRVGVEVSDSARGEDADFEGPLNLFYSLNQPMYFYPKYQLIPSTERNYRPKVIIIGDSYFRQIKDNRILKNILSEDSRFWYYFGIGSTPIRGEPWGLLVKDADVVEEMENADLVIVIGSISTIEQFPFGAEKYYFDNFNVPRVTDMIKQRIMRDSYLTSTLSLAAKSQNRSLEEVLSSEAKRIRRNRKAFHLLAANAKFVCANGGTIIADREEAYAWETFYLLDLGNDEVAIYSHDRKMLSVELASNKELTATRQQIGSWEVFKIVKGDKGFISFKADNGKFLSLNENSNKIFADADRVGPKEKFKMSLIN